MSEIIFVLFPFFGPFCLFAIFVLLKLRWFFSFKERTEKSFNIFNNSYLLTELNQGRSDGRRTFLFFIFVLAIHKGNTF